MYSWIHLSHLAEWTGATFSSSDFLGQPVRAISTDSRTLKAGEVFLALRGEIFDGHQFLANAVTRGASALISEKPFHTTVPLLCVEDSLVALVNIAGKMRDYFEGRVIAVTGSAGKSSTKNMIATCLGDHTIRSPASFNNLIGVSKTLFLLEDSTKYLVLEMGMNAPGEIRMLCDHFRPHIGIITNIGDAHIGKLGGKRRIFTAKKELFDFLASTGSPQVALNVGDPLVVEAHRKAFSRKVPTVTYCADNIPADVFITNKRIDPGTGFLNVNLSIRKKNVELELPIFGLHHAQNIAATTATALCVGIPVADLKTRLAQCRPALHRGEIFRPGGDCILIDESYNSNPSALSWSLKSFATLDPNRRKVLILGDMLELGEFSEKFHREAGDELARLLADGKAPVVVIGVGLFMSHFIDAVKKCPRSTCLTAKDWGDSHALAKEQIREKDIILVKGSRAIQLDLVVNKLLSQH